MPSCRVPCTGRRAAAASHSGSVGRRAPAQSVWVAAAQRAKASASKWLMCVTGVWGSSGNSPCRVNTVGSAALLALMEVPRALDAQGVVCSWHAPSHAIVVRSAHLPDAAIALPLDAVPTDLCVGGDGVLYVALPGRVLMHDLRRRWAAVEVSQPGFAPWRLAAHPEGGVWGLERGSGRLVELLPEWLRP